MSDEKLSQEQIDALLQAVSNGQAVEEFETTKIVATNYKFNEYDFNRPEKFGSEHLHSLRTIMTSFVKKTMQFVSSRVRLPMYVEEGVAQQVSFVNEYSKVTPKDYYLCCIVDLGLPHLGEIIVEFDLAFVIYIHECLAGGQAKRNFKIRRPLSQFEELTLKNIFGKFLESFKEAFDIVTPIQPRLVDVELDPNLLKVTTANDMMALINVDVKSDHWITTLRIGVPFFSVESIMDKLENVVENTFDKKKKFNEEIEKELKKVKKPLEISLGEIQTTLAEIQAIEVGDVVTLQTKVTDSLKGSVAGEYKFDCHIGKVGDKKAAIFKNFLD